MFGIFHSFFADFQLLFLISTQKAYFIALFSLTFVSKTDIKIFFKSICKANDKSSITNLWLPACLVVLLFLGALPGTSVAADTGAEGT